VRFIKDARHASALVCSHAARGSFGHGRVSPTGRRRLLLCWMQLLTHDYVNLDPPRW